MSFFNTFYKQQPKLSVISPLTHWIALGFIWLNLVLAEAIWTAKDPKLVIYNGLTDQHFWAITFVLLAGGIILGLITKNHAIVRYSMIVGLLIKAFIGYALVALAVQYGFTPIKGTIYLWGFLIWIQMGAVMFFLPPLGGRDEQ